MKRMVWMGLVVPLVLSGCSGTGYKHSDECDRTRDAPVTAPPLAPQSRADPLLEQWGIESHGVRLTSAGYMLDFRYRVHDAQKAAALLDRRTKAYVVVEKSDAKLGVPVSAKVGALRSSTRDVKEERNYFIMFSNPGRHVQSGDKVKIVIGDLVTETLTVM
jgi:hypothetical protein